MDYFAESEHLRKHRRKVKGEKMINVSIHFHGGDSKQQRLATLPHSGDYMRHGEKIWRVAYVMHNPPTTTWGIGTIDVYCVRMADTPSKKLARAWADWSLPAKSNEETKP